MSRSKGGPFQVNTAHLDALARDLAELRADIGPVIHKAMREGAELTEKKAAGRARSLGGLPAHVAPALSVDDTTVSLEGSGEWAMAPGAEFGRDRYHVHPYRGSNGYFLTPTISDTERERYEIAERVLGGALGKVD